MLKAISQSKQGQRSNNNEDASLAFTSAGIFAVADGVGGNPAGDQASKLTMNAISKGLSSDQVTQDSIISAICAANSNVMEYAKASRLNGMATTLTLAWVTENKVTCFNLGDSRIYHFRDDKLIQLTNDHIIKKQKNGRLKNYVTRAIGLSVDPGIELTEFHWQKGDILLLMSDGISDKLSDQRLGEICNNNQLTMFDKANHMIEEASLNGSTDDKTIIIVF